MVLFGMLLYLCIFYINWELFKMKKWFYGLFCLGLLFCGFLPTGVSACSTEEECKENPVYTYENWLSENGLKGGEMMIMGFGETDTCDLVDSYSETNQSTFERLTTDVGYSEISQSFTSNTTKYICKAKFWLKNTTGATGYAYAKLYSHSGTYGTNSLPNTLLATSEPLDVSTIGTDFALYTLYFDEEYQLSSSTYYVITLEYNDGGFPSPGIEVGEDGDSPTHSGNYAMKSGGVWGEYSGYDTLFYVYAGDLPVEPEPTPPEPYTQYIGQQIFATSTCIGGDFSTTTGVVSTSTCVYNISPIVFNLAYLLIIIIVILFLMVAGFLYNTMLKPKIRPWRR